MTKKTDAKHGSGLGSVAAKPVSASSGQVRVVPRPAFTDAQERNVRTIEEWEAQSERSLLMGVRART